MKTLLILMDGMRPDAIENMTRVKSFAQKSSYSFNTKTVVPSDTLPCHMSLFHSVEPGRHGITTNYYVPQSRPVRGLCEVLAESGKKSAFFYDWEQLRDLARPGSLTYSQFYKGGGIIGFDEADTLNTDKAIEYIRDNDIDFTFLYLGNVDYAGHISGWMSDEYIEAVNKSWDEAERIIATLPDDYTVFITADHGGHQRTHGSDSSEDTTIPLFVMGKDFEAGKELGDVSIMDIAPTITKLLGVEPDADWEGKSIV